MLTLGVLAAIASCRQVVGIADRDAPLECSAPTFASGPACGACLVDQCCAELTACEADPLCRSLLECTAACTDDACRTQCEAMSKLDEASAALAACEASRCDGTCGLACGGAGAPVTGCLSCASACCAEGKAYRGDLAGQRLRACRGTCPKGDFACSEACSNTHPEGAHLERAARECVARACGAAGDWSCIGNVERRKSSTEGSIVFFVAVSDATTLEPLKGVTAKSCAASDVDCQAPLSTATTSTQGQVALTILLAPEKGVDAFAGFVELTSPGYLPHLVYFVPPPTAHVGIAIGLLSTSAAEQLRGVAGVALAPDRGALGIAGQDCGSVARAGVSFSVDTADADSRRFYSRSPSAGGAEYDFAATSTTDVGFGGFFNLRAGTVTVTSRVDHLCVEAGVAQVAIRPGAFTLLNLPPTARP